MELLTFFGVSMEYAANEMDSLVISCSFHFGVRLEFAHVEQ